MPQCSVLPVYLTVREAMQRFSIGRTRLFEKMADGEIERKKLGKKTLIVTASLAAFMAKLPNK